MKHLDLLYSAINSPYGIEVLTESPDALRRELYKSMRDAKESGNLDFLPLSLHLSPVSPQTHLWIKKSGVPNGKAQD